MSGMDPANWFPLLSKELIELANRRRTYVVRFLYTAVLFGFGLLIVYGRGGALTRTRCRHHHRLRSRRSLTRRSP